MNYDMLKSCELCPRKCKIDRNSGFLGYCGADNNIKIARSALHFWEEPSISGTKGSGTVFFSHCNLGCIFCQNYKISKEHFGKYVNENELADIFIDLQKQNAHNINLVTPTHYIPQIASSLSIAKSNGLTIPVIYNCGGYEDVNSLKILNGLIDIYMPDFKYFSDKYSIKYSNAKGYYKNVTAALDEMFLQVGKNVFDNEGIMQKGMVVRHMILPGLLFDSKKILDYLYNTFGDDIFISIMSQYTPMPQCKKIPEINKTVDKKYYDTLVNYAQDIGIVNAYIQNNDSIGECYIPEFFDK